jgi:glycosyltransferase involved in cell wall biosynthesis
MPQGRITFSGLRRLYFLLKQLKPDVLQTWMYHADFIGGIVGRMAGTKSIIWNVRNSVLSAKSTKFSTIVVSYICAALSRFIPWKIIFCSQESLNAHARLGYNAKLMTTIFNGYDVNDFSPSNKSGCLVRGVLALPQADNIIGMVGRFDPLKDHNNLFMALNLVKMQGINFKCLLIGHGLSDFNELLVRLIADYDLYDNIYLLGQRNDIPSLMNALDMHVLSSFSEGFPNVLCEAMACGTPCITTDVGDAALIVGDTGWVVPSRNHRELADKILTAIHEKNNLSETWSRRKIESRERVVNNFSIEKMINNYHVAWSSHN